MLNSDHKTFFPKFSAAYKKAKPENVLPGASAKDLMDIEQKLGLKLPQSYKTFLSMNRQLWLCGGAIQFGLNHPFLYAFRPLSALTSTQKSVVKARGGIWPPPCDGLLCFAEYFWKADGDQVLFDTRVATEGNDYPVFYYAHNSSPAKVFKVGENFLDWIENSCIQTMRA